MEKHNNQSYVTNTSRSKKEPKDLLRQYQSSILIQNDHYPDPEYVLNLVQNDVTIPLLSLKSYSLWQGKQKSRKSTLLAMAIASYILSNKSNDRIKFERAGDLGRVLFIDTEQGRSFAARTMKLILDLAMVESCENLIYCDFREFTAQDRRKMIHAALAYEKGIKIVVIDGIVDMMDDFQDAKEGHEVITELLSICSKHNVHVAGVLHQNKTDENARSYIGLLSSQKCEVEISCKKDSKDRLRSLVECKEHRNWHFESFAIKREKDELPIIVQGDIENNGNVPSGVKNKKKLFGCSSLSLEQHKIIAQNIFKDKSVLNNGQLKIQITEQLRQYEEITDVTARKFVEYWEDERLIRYSKGKSNSKMYSLSEFN